MDAADLIQSLKLEPHPEGGHYRETFRDSDQDSTGRARSSLIYFLLQAGERSHWHRVDAVEIWHWYAGAALRLSIDDQSLVLGNALDRGEQPQAVVPKNAWQAAESLGAFTLVGCTVAPAFEFSGFELAPAGWSPLKEQMEC